MGRTQHAPGGGYGRKKRDRLNGFLGIELWSGLHFFESSREATSESVAGYFSRLAAELYQGGIRVLHVFLDRHSTHKAKMQACFRGLLGALGLRCEFHLMAGYSPKLNPVEYAIHLLRQRVLHQSECRRSLASFVGQIESVCQAGGVLSKEQIINLLAHIEGLVPEIKNLSP